MLTDLELLTLNVQYEFAYKQRKDMVPIFQAVCHQLGKTPADISLRKQKADLEHDMQILHRVTMRTGKQIAEHIEELYKFKFKFLVLTPEQKIEAQNITGLVLEKPGGLKLAT